MNIRRAGLAVLAASALTLSVPTTGAFAAGIGTPAGHAAVSQPGPDGSAPGAPGGYAAPATTGGYGTPAATTAPATAGGYGAPAATGGHAKPVPPKVARDWPFPNPLIDISHLMPSMSSLAPALFAVNVASFQCLAAPSNGGQAAQRRCQLNNAYRWKLVPASLDARFRIQNAGSGRCLVPAGGLGLATGACGSALSTTWRLKDAPGTGIYVINASTGRCLGVERNGSAVQYRCDGAVASRWTFRTKPNGKGVVVVNGGRP